MGKKKDESAEAVVEVIDPEKEVSVELNEKNEPIKAEVKKTEEPKYVTAEQLQETQRKSNAAFFAEQRKIQQMLERLESGLKPKEVAAVKPSGDRDQYDEMLERGEWRTPVDKRAELIAEKKFKELREQEKSEELANNERIRTSQLLENNKQTVMQRHPELNDSTSEKAMVFQQVISRNPDYLSNPFGPVLAMNDMENELRSQGKLVDSATTKIVETEVQRRARVGASGVPNGNGAHSNKIVLTKDEKQYCDEHKIKYETFASTKQKLNSQREIEA